MKSNKNNVFISKPLNYNIAIEKKYEKDILNLTNLMTRQVFNTVERLLEKRFVKEYFAQDESPSSQFRIILNRLSKKFTKIFNDRAKEIIEKMVGSTNRLSQHNINHNLKDASKEFEISSKKLTKEYNEIMKSSISWNVSLIKRIPERYFNRVENSIYGALETGSGYKSILEEIKKYNKMSNRQAVLLAKDQTKKVYSNLNYQRLADLKCDKFVWVHSRGSKEPRESHKKLNNKVLPMDDQKLKLEQAKLGVPEQDRGRPAQPVNCGCTMEIYLDF